LPYGENREIINHIYWRINTPVQRCMAAQKFSDLISNQPIDPH